MKNHCRRLAFLAFLLGFLLVPAAFAVEPAPEQAGFPEEEEEVVKRTPFEELAAANGERFVNPLSMSVAGGLRALGLTPQPPTAPAIGDEIVAQRRRTRGPLPPAADNSAGLPPVGDQGAQGSCVSWAVGYYLKSYQEGREHGWDLGDPAHQFSPAFLFNQLSVNYEPEEGYWLVSNTTFDYVFNQVLRHGCCSLAAMPYNDADYRTWPSAAAFKEAIPYRAESYAYIGHGQMDATLPAVKEILASGDLVVVGIPIYRPDRTTPGRFDLLAAGDADYEMPPISDNYLAGYHALTIVGYDESKFAGVGGYKIVNSWGAEWGDAGFAWLSEPFLTKFGTAFYTMTDRIGYQPTAMVHWKVGHSWWGPTYDAVTVSVGVGPKDRPLWSTKMVGGVLREDSWLCVDMWYDVSEAADYLPATWEQSWWLKVTDSYVAYAPTVYTFEIESGGTTADAAPMLPLEGNFFAYTHYFDVPCGEAASANYYVNDDYDPATDIYCTAPGDDANDGLTPATPKRT
ncbi:MAG: C1 family peptidase, partial [Lentisphaerae bacterium]|nr:C1 family peptidase [Lentisphaerota bacterium]